MSITRGPSSYVPKCLSKPGERWKYASLIALLFLTTSTKGPESKALLFFDGTVAPSEVAVNPDLGNGTASYDPVLTDTSSASPIIPSKDDVNRAVAAVLEEDGDAMEQPAWWPLDEEMWSTGSDEPPIPQNEWNVTWGWNTGQESLVIPANNIAEKSEKIPIIDRQVYLLVNGNQYNFSVGSNSDIYGKRITLSGGDKKYQLDIWHNRIGSIGVLPSIGGDLSTDEKLQLLDLIKANRFLRSQKYHTRFDSTPYVALRQLIQQWVVTGFRYRDSKIEELEISWDEGLLTTLKSLPQRACERISRVYVWWDIPKDWKKFLKEVFPNAKIN